MMKMPSRTCLALALAGVLAAGVVGCGASSGAVSPPASTTEATSTGAPEAPGVDGLDYAALLTPTDVEGVSGLSGLKVVPYDPTIGAGGKVNIAEADGQLVAMLLVQGPEYYNIWKGDGQTFLREYTPAVGEESFIGPAKKITPDSYIFAFRKGSYSVVVDTFFRVKGVKKVLSVKQLSELATIVASRL